MRSKQFRIGTVDQFKSEIENTIAKLGGDDVEGAANITASSSDDNYFEDLRAKVDEILVNQYHVDVISSVESFGIRFEVFIKDTYDELAEYVILFDDIDPIPADLENDANTLADLIISQCNNGDDADYDMEEGYEYEDI